MKKNIKMKKIIHEKKKIIDIIPINADKGLAIKFLSTKYNISFKNIHASGNSFKDIPMY